MNSSPDRVLKPETALTEVVAHGVLAREAGVPFQLASTAMPVWTPLLNG